MTEPQVFDFASTQSAAGFRLRALEVFNWGTFDGRVFAIRPEGENALLTGDIGSGKSTLVDAMTTLLVQRVSYNKAAGAVGKERDLRSYVLGYYKTERQDESLSARPVALRNRQQHSVILAVFHNASLAATVTLAQVFWCKDEGPPQRLFVVAESELAIDRDFRNFGKEIADLRKRLRALPQAEVFETFSEYRDKFKRLLGFQTEQALELFHQTVSMKSVGNLTDFVSAHMLDPPQAEERIRALVGHFDDLDRAHEAVLKAKKQLGELQPIVAECERHAELLADSERLKKCRDALKPWYAEQKLALLQARIVERSMQSSAQTQKRDAIEDKRKAAQKDVERLRQDIRENGGDQLAELTRQIERLKQTRDERRNRSNRFAELTGELGLASVTDAESFVVRLAQVEARHAEAGDKAAKALNDEVEQTVLFRQRQTDHGALVGEVKSLEARKSNIDDVQIQIRQRLCTELALNEADLPFVGELLKVSDDAAEWQGAIERVLRGFALSLLVPERHYTQVAAWLDRTHLRGLLVFYLVRDQMYAYPPDPTAQSLRRKVLIRKESPFAVWLARDLHNRFDLTCCETPEQFQREPNALLRSGLIKRGADRHEKDDRHRVDDRSRFVLGWENKDKLAALRQRMSVLQKEIQRIADQIAAAQSANKVATELQQVAKMALEYKEFSAMDWHEPAAAIAEKEVAKRKLEASSSILDTLAAQLKAKQLELTDLEEKLSDANDKLSRLRLMLEQDDAACKAAETVTVATTDDERAAFGHLMAQFHDPDLTIERCDAREREVRDQVTGQIDATVARSNRLSVKISTAMADFRKDWPVESQDFDASVDAATAWRDLLVRLRNDDLPRFERRFREALNTETIKEVVGFYSHLQQDAKGIRDRIQRINRSLSEIDYNPGHYIELQTHDVHDREILEFKQELRACGEDTLVASADERYSEQKFLQVKSIIQRLRGQEDSQVRWTRRVTDVRNWFEFSASERYRADGTEHEHYTDSGGKSGGQKEKLAYTVLAASLAYQFGLDPDNKRVRTFRFVVIDEAFGRGSAESARYGLELFQKLSLQLLVVTPLQKIDVIEPYVRSVGLVHNFEGRQSRLLHLTIAEYRARKAREAVA